jgi:hypothetical protein
MHNFKLQTKHFALLAFTSLMFLLMVVAFVGSQKSREFRSKAAYPPEDPCDTNPSRCQPTTPPPPNITNPPVSVRPTVTPTAQPPQVPNCSNLSGPPRLTVGQAGTYTARFYSQVANSKGRIDIADATKNPAPLVPPWGSSQNYVDSKETGVVDGNSGTGSISWTPTTTGTYFLYCRAWNDGIAECRGDAAYVDGPPRYTCAGPNASMTVTVSATPQAKYKCSGASCVRDDTNGTYTSTNCDNACQTTTAKYKCSGTSCVRDDTNGTYTSANCDNACQVTSCTRDADCSGGNVCAFP